MRVRSIVGACVALLPLLDACTGSHTPSASPHTPAITFDAPPVAGCHHGSGRPGQSHVLVPDQPTSVTVCSDVSQGRATKGRQHTIDTVTGTGLSHLISVLNARPVGPTTITECDGGGLARTYSLDFTYPSGPDVAVDVGPDCHPSISNGSVATDNTLDVMVAIDSLIGVRCSALIC